MHYKDVNLLRKIASKISKRSSNEYSWEIVKEDAAYGRHVITWDPNGIVAKSWHTSNRLVLCQEQIIFHLSVCTSFTPLWSPFDWASALHSTTSESNGWTLHGLPLYHTRRVNFALVNSTLLWRTDQMQTPCAQFHLDFVVVWMKPEHNGWELGVHQFWCIILGANFAKPFWSTFNLQRNASQRDFQ